MIYTRSEIIDLLYSGYGDNETIQMVKNDLMKMSDEEFIDLCEKSYIHLKPLRKNTYYWTR